VTAAPLSFSVPLTAVSTRPPCAVPVIEAAVVKASGISVTALVGALVEVVAGPPSLSVAVSTTRNRWPSSASTTV
jgi:hypothetical protein